MTPDSETSSFSGYASRLADALQKQDWSGVATLESELVRAWKEGNHVYICGNGGSAANAVHWANDMLYVIAKEGGPGIRIMALPANVAVVTCLGNDIGYDNIFSAQLATFGRKGDILVVLSGSGNSPNVVHALKKSTELGMKSFALLGYSGGACKALADVAIHFAINDMQIVEDMQLAVCHMLAQSLAKQQKHGN
ncbi:MAG TPA: SIS domain-containing protein [Chthoniobacteraceae bacterium]|nr:SIS domain-containing protein [Chthoniobacteraceae bacterium]